MYPLSKAKRAFLRDWAEHPIQLTPVQEAKQLEYLKIGEWLHKNTSRLSVDELEEVLDHYYSGRERNHPCN